MACTIAQEKQLRVFARRHLEDVAVMIAKLLPASIQSADESTLEAAQISDERKFIISLSGPQDG